MGRPWRLPQKPRRYGPERPRPAPRAAKPAPCPGVLEFVRFTLGGVEVTASPTLLSRFPESDLQGVLREHGSAPGPRQTKHRARRGTLFVQSSAGRGEVAIMTPEELRVVQPPKRPR